MNIQSLSRKTRRSLGVVAVVGAVAVFASSALGGPIVEVGGSWTAVTGDVGPFTTPDGGTTITAPGGGASIPAGSYLQTQYCNPYGANTHLVGARVRRVRWHATANDIFAFMRIQGPDGVDLSSRYLYNQGISLEMQKDAVHDDSVAFAGQCFYGGIYANGTSSNLAFTTLVTNQIQGVKVEDLQGPAVSGTFSWSSWLTGNAAPVEWDHSDNGFLRGNTYASVVGGDTADLGDQPDGHNGAWVGVGALADGQHQICAYRSAAAGHWATAGQCTVFKLDRTSPGVPTIGLSPDTGGVWTNTDVTVTTAATGDGTGSGWNRNQFSWNGGAGWNDSPAAFTRTTEGTLSIVARAVDTAGHVSGLSSGRVVKIDKTAPTASVSVASQTIPGRVTLAKGATGDALSGLKRFAVHLGAANGPIVATTDAELVDIGQSAPAKDIGATKLYLVADDNAGNTATASTPTLRLDSIAPSASLQATPTGWVKDFAVTGALDNRLSATLADNVPDGLGAVEVQIRQGAGDWKNMATYNQPGSPALGQGRHLLAPSTGGLGLVDGNAEIRVVAHDPTFTTLIGVTPAQAVKIDQTSPDASDTSRWGATATGTAGVVRISLPTLADATSGLATVQVSVNSDPTGGQAEAGFGVVGTLTDPTGTVALDANVAGMAAGIHATRVVATDRAGNVFVTSGPVIVLDTALPTVSPLAISTTGLVSFTMLDAGGFGACPVVIAINGPATNGAWQTLFEQAAGTLPANFSFQLPMSGMADGDYQVRAGVCDAGGNLATQTKVFAWTGGPKPAVAVAGTTVVAGGTAVSIQLTELTADGQVATRLVNGKVVPVVRGVYNRRFVLRGRLQAPDGGAMANAGLELRDSTGRYIAGARTDAAGGFAIPSRATIGGVWTVNHVGQVERIAAAVLEVTPIVRVAMKMGGVRNGGRKLVVTGRLIPQAGAFNKAIQLQWQDPFTNAWRPVVNGRVARNGQFRILYQFRRPGGYKVAFRVAVPHDNGWPYLATNSRAVKVKVL